MGAKVPGNESSMERKFLGHSLLRSESSTGAKVTWSKSSRTFRSTGANVPVNESSTGMKVPSVDFSLPGTKVQRNKKSWRAIHQRLHTYDSQKLRMNNSRICVRAIHQRLRISPRCVRTKSIFRLRSTVKTATD